MIDEYSILIGVNNFCENGSQNQLVFQPFSKCATYFGNVSDISTCTAKWMSEEIIKNPSTLHDNFTPKWVDKYETPNVKLNGNCLNKLVYLIFIEIYIFFTN